MGYYIILAEGVGFEPTIRVNAYTLSKRAPSATRPPLLSSAGAKFDPAPIDPPVRIFALPPRAGTYPKRLGAATVSGATADRFGNSREI